MEGMKRLRKEKGLSQQELADLTGVSQKMVYLVEMGQRRPSVDLAKKIAKVLEFDWTKFYEDEAAE